MAQIIPLKSDHPVAESGLLMSALQAEKLNVVRIRTDESRFGFLPDIAPEDAYIVAVKLRRLDAFNLFFSGIRAACTPIAEGSMCLLNREQEIRLDLQVPFDIVQFNIPYELLLDASADSKHGPTRSLYCPPLGTPDAVICNLSRAVLPALSNPQRASQLFVSSIAMAMGAHLLSVYGGKPLMSFAIRGGLAAWQERLAKEILAENLAGHIAIAALAAECGLSAAHFATAFKKRLGNRQLVGWQSCVSKRPKNCFSIPLSL